MEYPLNQNVYNSNDVLAMIKSLLTEKFTMGSQVEQFEREFAKFLGIKYAVMVNSGSSANLLGMSILTNHKRNIRLNPGDEVLVPAVCWSTSVFPIIQTGLIPIFVDIDKETLNIDINDMKKKITPRTKAIVLVHVLGNCTDMDEIISIVRAKKLIVLEDTCESLGSKYKGKYLGTFGDLGTYSFYFSHQITTIEGGMIICSSEEDYELAKCLRAHGWTRNLNNKKELHNKNPLVDPRFMFVNLGYNFRPMEIQGSMGLIQLNKLKNKNDNRIVNYNKIKSKLLSYSTNIFSFPRDNDDINPAWFGIPILLNSDYSLFDYLNYLTKNGIENRPIITGNMIRQPVIQDLYPKLKPEDFLNSDYIHFHGFFIGLSCDIISDETLGKLTSIMLKPF